MYTLSWSAKDGMSGIMAVKAAAFSPGGIAYTTEDGDVGSLENGEHIDDVDLQLKSATVTRNGTHLHSYSWNPGTTKWTLPG